MYLQYMKNDVRSIQFIQLYIQGSKDATLKLIHFHLFPLKCILGRYKFFLCLCLLNDNDDDNTMMSWCNFFRNGINFFMWVSFFFLVFDIYEDVIFFIIIWCHHCSSNLIISYVMVIQRFACITGVKRTLKQLHWLGPKSFFYINCKFLV